MAVEQKPSAWAVHFTLIDENGAEQKLFWDYVIDTFFAWEKGVFLVWENSPESPNERIAGVDQYPPAQSGPFTPQEKLLQDCRESFNDKIKELFFSSSEPHPVDPDVYEYLLQRLIWDVTTQRFV